MDQTRTEKIWGDTEDGPAEQEFIVSTEPGNPNTGTQNVAKTAEEMRRRLQSIPE